jgi:hypothetical protein
MRDAKKVQIHPTDPNKTMSIAVDPDPTKESTLIEFLHEHWKSLPGVLPTCQEFPENLSSMH